MVLIAKIIRRTFAAAAFALVAVSLSWIVAASALAESVIVAGNSFVQAHPGRLSLTNRLIVKLRNRNEARARRLSAGRMFALSSGAGIKLSHIRSMSGDAQLLRLPRLMTTAEAAVFARKLSANADVEYAVPDEMKWPLFSPNDPWFPIQWHYQAFSSEIGGANLPAAWDITQGAGSIVVAVIDTGLVAHTEMSGRTVAGYDFVSEDAPNSFLTANDGNGRDSDPSDPGDWITAEEEASGLFPGSQIQDSSWHGTHVAGTIGANSNNSSGVAGINWYSKVQPVRVIGKGGGYDSDIIDGMRWAAGLSVVGAPVNASPAKALNLSLGGISGCSAAYQAAINEIIAAGAVVVVAAGNDNADAALDSPGNCLGVITVAATKRNGGRASYSNFGPTVEISAPGGDLTMTSPGNFSAAPDGVLSLTNSGTQAPISSTVDFFKYLVGTSMATPHISGIVSLMFSVRPSLTPAQVLSKLQASARAFPTGTDSDCTTSTCGAGIVNAADAVKGLNLAAPGLSGAAQSASSILWNWTTNGNSCPASLTYTLINASNGATINSGTALTFTEPLPPNQLQVRVVKAACQTISSPLSLGASVYTLPDLPTLMTLTAITTGSVTLGWSSTNPNYTRFAVTYSPDAFATTSLTRVAFSDNFTGTSLGIGDLTAGTLYFIRVQAFSGKSSDAFGGTGTTFLIGSFSTKLTQTPAVVGAGSSASAINWSWSAIAGVQGYRLYVAGGSPLLIDTTLLSFSQTGLGINSKHGVEIEAYNASGPGPRSAPVFAFTKTTDPASPAITAVSSNSVGYSWGANGNPSDTFYEVNVADDPLFASIAATVFGKATSAIAGGLLPDVLYYARVRSISGSQATGNFIPLASMRTLGDALITSMPTPPSAYRAPSGTIGQWQFDENTGLAAADSSGLGNAAVLSCSAPACTPTFTAGPPGLGGAVLFSGLNNGLVRIPNIPSYNFTDKITVSAWVNPSTLSQPNGAGLVVRGNGGVENFALDVSGGRYRFAATPLKIVSSTNLIAVGTWTHLIGVYDSAVGSATLYVNGSPAETALSVPARTAAAHDISIGNRQSAAADYDRGFLGSIDSVRIQNRALNAAEALAEYKGSFVSTVTSPVPNNAILVGLAPNAFSAPATIFISADPFAHPIKILPAVLSAGLAVIPAGYALVPNSIIEIVPIVGGVPLTQTLGSAASISMPYSDADGDSIIDNTNPPLAASKILVFTLNTTVNRWEALPTSRDSSSRRVTAITPHFSVFGMFVPQTVGTELSAVRAYPIPWRPGTGGKFDAVGITFDRLPVSGTIRILDLAGERVREISFDGSAAGSVLWNGLNDHGRRAASGVYFAYVTRNGAAAFVKFAIER